MDLPAETSGLIPDPDWKRKVYKDKWYPSETVSISIGQGGVLATPLQMARLAAVVANGGRLVKPHLIKAVAGVPVPPPEPVDLGFHPSVVAAVRAGMVAVVEEGRAPLGRGSRWGQDGSAHVVTHARFEATEATASTPRWSSSSPPPEQPTSAMAVLGEHGTAGGPLAAPSA